MRCAPASRQYTGRRRDSACTRTALHAMRPRGSLAGRSRRNWLPPGPAEAAVRRARGAGRAVCGVCCVVRPRVGGSGHEYRLADPSERCGGPSKGLGTFLPERVVANEELSRAS
ncbi:hypothetical protein GCM10020000_00060 [Streptomyces olivoverticillatus]